MQKELLKFSAAVQFFFLPLLCSKYFDHDCSCCICCFTENYGFKFKRAKLGLDLNLVLTKSNSWLWMSNKFLKYKLINIHEAANYPAFDGAVPPSFF